MPSRILRTQALTSRKLGMVSPEAEALYYRLMLVADDYGRFYGDPLLVQSYCYPRHERQVAEPFRELIAARALHLYEVDSETYLMFDVWDQTARSASRYPEPPTDVRNVRADVRNVSTDREQVSDLVVSRDSDSLVGDEDGAAKPRNPLYTEAFETFWTAYPSKEGKAEAAKAFDKAIREQRVALPGLLEGVRRYVAMLGENPDRPIKNAQGWLNHDRWTDEYAPRRGGLESVRELTDEDRALLEPLRTRRANASAN